VINKISLPCFCYHERLTIAGNCRICLVLANNALGVSCAISLVEDMEIFSDNYRTRLGRESVMELLLSNHPLDCPICDQAGECDLQDISQEFGLDKGRFYENSKRSVDNLTSSGPFVKTIMTRCIHCTRCVRYLGEIAGSADLGTLERGVEMEVSSFDLRCLMDVLSGNIIDLCPVGALTSMPYAFNARPWDLESAYGIDVFDALASSIRIDLVGNRVMRILPVLNENINEE
jgi:NADH dehydrogenase/NADH:ubiquinone oxidoreductase subunit G